MPKLSIIVVSLLFSLLAACHGGPLAPKDFDRPELVRIQDALTEVVQRAHDDPKVEWVYGWDGNGRIVETGEDGSVMGYCWQWQEHVYAEMAAAVRREKWDLVRLNINRDHFSEHHAVAIWDPKDLSAEDILRLREGPIWVMDPWLEGEAQIFRLEDWLSIPVIVFEPAALEL